MGFSENKLHGFERLQDHPAPRRRLITRAPALTICQIHLLLTNVLLKPIFDAQETLRIVRYSQWRGMPPSYQTEKLNSDSLRL